MKIKNYGLKIILLAGLFAGALPAYAGVTIVTPPTTGLVGYWKMDEGSWNGTTGEVRDSSNQHNNGSSTIATTISNSKIGRAGSFNGTTAYIDLGNPASLNITKEITMSAWVYPTAYKQYGAFVYRAYDGGRAQYRLTWGGTSPNWGVSFVDTGLTWRDYWAGNLPLNTWSHIVAVVKSGSYVEIYMNGVLVQRWVITYSMASGSGPNYIARQLENNAYLPANIDDVRIYNRALSANEVAELYKFAGARVVTNQNLAKNNQINLASGLVGYWTFDAMNMGTTSAVDLSGNGNTGWLINGVRKVVGKIGQALKFDGTNSYVGVKSVAILNTLASSSVCGWANSNLLSGQRFIYIETYVGGPLYMLNITNSNATFYVHGTGGWSSSTGATTLSVGKWYHLCGVYSSAGTKIYVNGALDGSDSTIGHSDTVSDVSIGRCTGGGCTPSANTFSGSLDDVRIYNRALSASEVQQLYQLGSAKIATNQNLAKNNQINLASGLVGYWTFDAMNMGTTSAVDLSGNSNTGWLINGVKKVAGKIGQALNFNGTTGYISVADASPLNITGSVSVAAWIKPKVNNADQKILGKQDANNGYKLSLYSNGKIEFELDSSGSATNIRNVSGGTVLSPNVWYHVVGVYDSSAQTLSAYVNGALDRTTTASGSVLGTTSAVLEIGASIKDGSSNLFNGNIDDARVYNRALSASEVQQLYRLGR